MLSIFKKEINTFFSSLIGYVVIGVFLIFMGLMLWVFPDYSLLKYSVASLDALFEIAPLIFLFLIPAITMRSFAEEKQTGTIELLVTRPLRDWEIVLGKFFACWLLVIFAVLPTILYYYTMHELGSPKGNLDAGAIAGSYIGLALLGGTFVAIGLLASSITNNQIIAFICALFFCFIFYWGFDYVSRLPVFLGKSDDIVQMLGIDYHYTSISRGVLDSRDIIYFVTVMGVFLTGSQVALESRKW
ncbi:MAG: gliding motility-associated ABC transporter permease subunit GldF [Bacteroidota bacterium]